MQQDILFENAPQGALGGKIEALKKLFPSCVDKEGKVILEKLGALLGQEGGFSSESYGLQWLGKAYARMLTEERPFSMLELEQNAPSQNLLIRGDNLEALKHLQHGYYEKIKCIYIDPPYNTGNDAFIYQDKRAFSPQDLGVKAGMSEGEARRVLDFIAKGANTHSAWLTFMFPRLVLARHLLREDGAIFISIDDNEQAPLKLLCDEVFGESNFVGSCIYEKVKIRKNSALYFSESHEYVLVYAKNKSQWHRNLLPRKDISNYKNPDNDPRGVWIPIPIHANHYYNADYKITKPNGVVLERPKNQSWRLSEENFKKHVEENRIWWGKGDGYPMIKRFLSEVQNGLVPKTIFYYDETGGNPAGDEAVKNIFNGVKMFENPKPLGLIQQILQIATTGGGGENPEIVLDFFAGSGTTGQAVMAQNLADGGKRQFILIQLDEPIDPKKSPNAYNFCQQELGHAKPTIFDITQERLKRAKAKLEQEHAGHTSDLSFKVLRLQEKKGCLEDIQTFQAQELNFPTYSQSSLLTTWMAYDGIPLSLEPTPILLATYTAFLCASRLYLLSPHFDMPALKALLEKLDSDPSFKPSVIVACNEEIDSPMQRALCENLKALNNRKNLEIKTLIRLAHGKL